MKKHTCIATVLSFLILASGVSGELLCDPVNEDEWLIGRGDSRLTGYRRAELSDDLRLLWRFQTDDVVRGTPVVRDGRVYVGSLDGRLYILDLSGGTLIASLEAGSGIEGSPLLAGSAVYVGTEDGEVFGFGVGETSESSMMGNRPPLWRATIEGRIAGGLNLAVTDGSGLLVFGGYDAALHALDVGTGEEVWASAAGNYINGTPAVLGDMVLYGSCDSRVHFLSVSDGSRLGEADLGSYIPGSPSVWESTVYAGTYMGSISAVDAGSMEEVWRWNSDGEAHFFSSPAVNEHRVVAGSREGGIYCLERRSGELAWRTWLGGGADGAPVIAGGKVVVGSDDGRLYLLRLSNGREIWSYETGGGISSAPAVVAGIVLIGSDDGYLYAFGTVQ